jgi:hypothetical protein
MRLESGIVFAAVLALGAPCAAQQLANQSLLLTVDAQKGTYELSLPSGQIILTSRVAAEVDHAWVRSTD